MAQPHSSPTAVRFGPFEVDIEQLELRKSGLRIRIQEQPFQVLAALLERPGEIVTREELVQRLWPSGTYVDFERGLNAAIARLRQALNDSAETPRYIETVARRGYRFVAPVEIIAEPEIHDSAPVAPVFSDTRPSVNVWRWRAAAAVLLAITAVVWWSATRGNGARVLEQITRDRGLSTDAALSPDGKLLAYASDREGRNLNIWVQQMVSGGTAVQLTHDDYDAHQPAFSPDGSRIAYRSEREGGGLYVIHAIGGEAVLLAKAGRDPRFSPDGKWVAYWAGIESGNAPQADASGAVFVVPSSGGEPKQVGAQVPEGGYPIWSPDSTQLLVYGNPRVAASLKGADWWIVALDGRAPQKTGAFDALLARGFSLAFASAIPRAWIWADEKLVFSAQKGDTRNIWQIPFDAKGRITGTAEQLTQGTTVDISPSVAGRGVLAFATLLENTAIWAIPVNVNDARAIGDAQRVTEGDTSDAAPSISLDGRTLVYGSTVPRHEDIWVKDLQSGKKTAIASKPAAEWHPIVSRDGSMVAYTIDDPNAHGIYVVPARGGEARFVGPDTAWIFDWTPDKSGLLYHRKAFDPALKLVDVGTGKVSDFLAKKDVAIFQSKFSPDGGWLLFLAVSMAKTDKFDSTLRVVKLQNGRPAPGAEWIEIVGESAWADKPRWSPDGNGVYFISERDGFRCVWAQRLDPATKRAAGEPIAIAHFHNSRLSPANAGLALLELDVSRDKVVINLGELTGNIWVARRWQ